VAAQLAAYQEGLSSMSEWVSEYRYSDRGVKLTTHLRTFSRSRLMELYLHYPICLYGIVLNILSTGTNLLYFTYRWFRSSHVSSTMLSVSKKQKRLFHYPVSTNAQQDTKIEIHNWDARPLLVQSVVGRIVLRQVFFLEHFDFPLPVTVRQKFHLIYH
jgi:hypothetical protein